MGVLKSVHKRGPNTELRSRKYLSPSYQSNDRYWVTATLRLSSQYFHIHQIARGATFATIGNGRDYDVPHAGSRKIQHV